MSTGGATPAITGPDAATRPVKVLCGCALPHPFCLARSRRVARRPGRNTAIAPRPSSRYYDWIYTEPLHFGEHPLQGMLAAK